MKLHLTGLQGLVVAESLRNIDSRGSFARLYCERELIEIIGNRSIKQINQSITLSKGAVRGLHFQHPPHSEMKLIRCLRGRVWDVAVDLRKESPTFMRWYAEELTPANGRVMIIPEGFAHGFQALEAGSELLYLHTAFYEPGSEGGLYCRDPRLGIPWPLVVTDLSERDANHPLINFNFEGVGL